MKGLTFTRLGSESVTASLHQMTFPKFVPLLEQAGSSDNILAVAARLQCETPHVSGGNPNPVVGLAVAMRSAPDQPGELLSLFTVPRLRRTGVGLALLQELEEAALRLGWDRLETVYMTRLPRLADFESVLRRRGWSEPHRRMFIFQSTRERLQRADFMNLFGELPQGFAIKFWKDVGRDQRLDLEDDLSDSEIGIPPDVNPFMFEGLGIDGKPAEPALSFAAMASGRVVGWHMAHRLSPQAVRFSCSFVRPSFQNQLPLLAMWVRAFSQLEEAGYSKVSWSVSPHHEAMVRFNERIMLPYVEHFDETRGSGIHLRREGHPA